MAHRGKGWGLEALGLKRSTLYSKMKKCALIEVKVEMKTLCRYING